MHQNPPTAPSGHWHSTACSSSAPCRDCRHFGGFGRYYMVPTDKRLGRGTDMRFWSQFHVSQIFRLLEPEFLKNFSVARLWLTPVTHVDRRKTPHPGGFHIYYVPQSRTQRKRTPHEAPCINCSGKVLFLRVLD